MKKHLFPITFAFVLVACNSDFSRKPKTSNQSESPVVDNVTIKKDVVAKRLSFKNVQEVVNDTGIICWAGQNESLSLHFNLLGNDTLCVAYSAECWLKYPYKIDNNKIIVYWSNWTDSKYEFDLVKAVYNIDDKYLGKAFMTLELVNDTTLKATYPIPKLIKRINASNKERIFFPERFVLSQEFLL